MLSLELLILINKKQYFLVYYSLISIDYLKVRILTHNLNLLSFKAYLFYVLDPDVLNGINWSSDLDEVFKRNRQEFPGIYWQSFGSRNGYLRVYPAAR